MADNNRLFHPRTFAVAMGLLAVPSAGLSVAASSGGLQVRAKETLFRCMERSSFVTLSAIIVQKGGPTCPSDVQIKIEQDRGKRKETILQPLSSQGFISVNDGKRIQHYNPDREEKVIQPLVKAGKESLRERMELAEENYRFEIARNGTIAGRSTWVVTATPKANQLPARRYSIDIDKDVLLRFETVENGRRNLRFDTQAIFYPERMDEETFTLKPVGEFKIITVPGPQRIESPAIARAKAGFEPFMPKDLPFGFIISDSHLTGKEEARFVAVRITDGLIQATIYQWDPKRANPFGGGANPLTRTIRGIRIGLVGDLPEMVSDRLLDLFAKEAARAFIPASEPPAAPAALKKIQKPRSDGGLVDSDRTDPDDDEDRTPVDEALMETIAGFLTVLQSSSELQ